MLTHWTCVIPPCPVCTVWSVFTTSDLFCKNWHFGIERFTAPHSVALWKGQLSLKKSVRPADTLRVRETREREREFLLNTLVGCTIDSCFVLTWFGRSLSLGCAELCCSLLLDAVISSVHGQITVCSILSGGGLQDGGTAGGVEGGREEALIRCYIRKITFLLMYPSGRLLYLVVFPVFLFVCKPHEISV